MCVVTFDWEKNDAVEKFGSFHKSRSLAWSVIELTDCCNFNCKWCFTNASRIRNPLHMDISDVRELVGTLADAGVRQITYSGGEPTLYPHIREAVSIARERGMVVHMNTNGYLLDRGMAAELKEAGLSQVQINIDSTDPRKHDAIRGKEGSHGRAIMALKNARQAGMTCVSQTVLTRENENEAVDIFRLARSLGIQRCRTWDMTPSDGCARENSKQLLPRDYLAVLQRLSDFAYETGARNVEVGDPMFAPHVKTKLSMSGGFCVIAAGMHIYISTRGDVYFCCTSRNVLYNVFEKIREGEDINNVHMQEVARYLEAFDNKPGCRDCEHVSLCNGGCYTRREFSSNDTDYWCRRCSG